MLINTHAIMKLQMYTWEVGKVMSETNKGYIAMACQTIIIGLSFIFVKTGLAHASPMDMLAHRFVLAFIVASIVNVFRNKDVQAKVTVKTVVDILPLALFYPFLFFIFQAYGLLYISSAEAGIIQSFGPIFTVILAAIILGERSSKGQVLFILLSVIGALYLSFMKSTSESDFTIIGTVLILLSSLSVVTNSVLSRKLSKNYEPFTLTYIVLGLGALVFTVIALGMHWKKGTLSTFIQPLGNVQYLGALVYLGIISTLVSSFLANFALKRIEASKLGVFGNIGTVVTVLAGVLILKEPFYSYHFIGGAIILAGVIGANILKQKQKL